ncbi:MAG: hypothetical protein ACLP3K_05640 [Candidatus Acidiferrales bacterium]
MPVEYQAFASKRSIWASHVNRNDNAGDALRAIFGKLGEVTLSRSDLRSFACKPDLAQFVMATIIWGYPRGMRGNHVANLISHLSSLTQLLSDARTEPVAEWGTYYDAKVRPIGGIGLSTYTKFLSFLSVKVQGHMALILDDRIIRVANQGIFEELMPLQELSSYNAPRSYPQYLECIHGLADSLEVSPEKIEFFLFEFGLHLKPPSALQVPPTDLPQAAFR